jgi:hypothetical protein
MTEELKPLPYRFYAITRRCACPQCQMFAGYQGVAFSVGGVFVRTWLGLS